MAAILEVSGLKKSYKNFELKNVSFSIPEDCITGFIGVNGAGKTTTINALLNLVHRDSGIIKFRGKDISTDEKAFKDKIGVVFTVIFRCVAVVGVLLQIILGRKERGQAPKL